MDVTAAKAKGIFQESYLYVMEELYWKLSINSKKETSLFTSKQIIKEAHLKHLNLKPYGEDQRPSEVCNNVLDNQLCLQDADPHQISEVAKDVLESIGC